MIEGNEIAQQDANETEESSAPQDNNQATEQQTQVSANDGETDKSQAQLPFHEHPRFKELIEERKSYASQIQEMRQQYQDLQRQIQSQKPKEDNTHAFVKKLGEIDPAYGEWASNLEKKAAGFEEFQSWKQDQESKALVSSYESSIDKLHTEHKVPEDLKAVYKDLLDSVAIKNPNFGVKDVPEAYKKIHERFSGLLETTKRAERASYLKDKTKDASAPAAQSKGKPAGHKPAQSMDREAVLGNIVKSALAASKAESDL